MYLYFYYIWNLFYKKTYFLFFNNFNSTIIYKENKYRYLYRIFYRKIYFSITNIVFIKSNIKFHKCNIVWQNIKKNEISDKEIFPERGEDIKYILNFIENKDNKNITTLGIDSKFGTGKTFIVDKILEKLNTEEYEQIKVRCLFLEKEEVYYYIIEKIKKVLSKNLIFISN